jgi:ATP-dependent protease HslVU (ClpYQ) peptidase subunit
MTSIIAIRNKEGGVTIGSDSRSSMIYKGSFRSSNNVSKYFKSGDFYIASAGSSILMRYFKAKWVKDNLEVTVNNMSAVINQIIEEMNKYKQKVKAARIFAFGSNKVIVITVFEGGFVTSGEYNWSDIEGSDFVALGSGAKYVRAKAKELSNTGISNKELVRRVLQAAKSRDINTGGRLVISSTNDTVQVSSDSKNIARYTTFNFTELHALNHKF